MQGKERTFTPQVEKVWNKDYQCEYYRGVIIELSVAQEPMQAMMLH